MDAWTLSWSAFKILILICLSFVQFVTELYPTHLLKVKSGNYLQNSFLQLVVLETDIHDKIWNIYLLLNDTLQCLIKAAIEELD